MSLLTIAGLNLSCGGQQILRDVDLEVEEGSRTCVMGRSGMGKTTLLKCIMGLLPATTSAMTFDGTDLRALPSDARAALGIGYVPQGGEMVPHLTVDENLRAGLELSAAGPQAVPRLVYDLVPQLAQMKRRRGEELSAGERQQLAIGRALVCEPKLLILDEPTHGIQPALVHEIGTILRDLNTTLGVTLLLVDNNLPFARRVSSDFRILEEGRIVANGPIEGLTNDIIAEHLST
jgi:urea transport system ATP-binding protein